MSAAIDILELMPLLFATVALILVARGENCAPATNCAKSRVGYVMYIYICIIYICVGQQETTSHVMRIMQFTRFLEGVGSPLSAPFHRTRKLLGFFEFFKLGFDCFEFLQNFSSVYGAADSSTFIPIQVHQPESHID